MKKICTLFVLFFPVAINAQVPRYCMIEEFTQAGCSPCALYNSWFEPNILNTNPDRLKLISYHTYFPGTDPMYTHNPSGNDTRWYYYNPFGDPSSYIEGNWKVTDPADITQRDVDDVWNYGSPLKITVS